MYPVCKIQRRREEGSQVGEQAYQDNRKNAEESSLEPGTSVLCLEPKKKRGLSAVWQGPFVVKKGLGLATYLLDVGNERTRRMRTRCTCLRSAP